MLKISFLVFIIFKFTIFAGEVKPDFAFPQHIKYAKATIYPDNLHDMDITKFYQYWKRSYLKKEGNLYRVSTGFKTPHRTVSEGQGYGMIITALMAGYEKNAKKIFDGLWYFSRKYKSRICSDLMAWEVPITKGQNDSAFDGDVDIAYALLLADKQWGSDGEINYSYEAKKLINTIYTCTIGEKSFLPLLGDWVEQNGQKYNQYTPRSSDFILGHFRAFYRFTKDKRWLNVIKSSQRVMLYFQSNISKETGLISDFIKIDSNYKTLQKAENGFLEQHDDKYYYNAARVPLRVGADALINGDKYSRKILQKISIWIEKDSSGNPANIKAGYHVEAKPIGNYSSTIFVAPFAVAAMSVPTQQKWLNKLCSFIKNRREDYYEDSINLLSLLLLNGNFWDPTKMPSQISK